MRVTYYTFPAEASPADCISAYLKAKEWTPDMNDLADRVHFRNLKSKIEEYGEIECSVSFAKKLLRAIGGNAYTQHFDRSGGLFETTPILLTGNNSQHHYSRHL